MPYSSLSSSSSRELVSGSVKDHVAAFQSESISGSAVPSWSGASVIPSNRVRDLIAAFNAMSALTNGGGANLDMPAVRIRMSAVSRCLRGVLSDGDRVGAESLRVAVLNGAMTTALAATVNADRGGAESRELAEALAESVARVSDDAAMHNALCDGGCVRQLIAVSAAHSSPQLHAALIRTVAAIVTADTTNVARLMHSGVVEYLTARLGDDLAPATLTAALSAVAIIVTANRKAANDGELISALTAAAADSRIAVTCRDLAAEILERRAAVYGERTDVARQKRSSDGEVMALIRRRALVADRSHVVADFTDLRRIIADVETDAQFKVSAVETFALLLEAECEVGNDERIDDDDWIAAIDTLKDVVASEQCSNSEFQSAFDAIAATVSSSAPRAVLARAELLSADIIGKSVAPIHKQHRQSLIALLKRVTAADNAEVTRSAVRLLENICRERAADADFLADISTIRELIAAIRRNVDCAEFVSFALFLLTIISQRSRQAAAEIGSEGGINVVIELIARHIDHYALIERLTVALAHVVVDLPVNAALIVACGGIAKLMSIRQVYRADAKMIRNVLCAVCNAADVSAAARDTFIALPTAVRSLVESVSDVGMDVTVAALTVRTIGAIAYNRAGANAFFSAHAVAAIVLVLSAATDTATAMLCVHVLTQLANDVDADALTTLSSEGATNTVTTLAIRLIDADESAHNQLFAQCVLFLTAACVSEANTSTALHSCADRIVVRTAASRQTADERRHISAHVTSFLRCCSKHAALANQLVNAAIVKAMESILITFNQDAAVIADLIAALFNFTSGLHCLQELAQPTLIDALVLAASRCADIRLSAINTLSRLAQHETAAGAITASAAGVALCSSVLTGAINDNQMANAVFVVVALVFSHSSVVSASLSSPLRAAACISAAMMPAVLHCANRSVSDSDAAESSGVSISESRRRHRLRTSSTLISGLRAVEVLAKPRALYEVMQTARLIDYVNETMRICAGDADVVIICEAILLAHRRHGLHYDAAPPPPSRAIRSARELFGPSAAVNAEFELPIATRNFLLAGALLIKHSQTAPPRKRHIFVSADLQFVCWKEPSAASAAANENRMKLTHVTSVDCGLVTPQLRRRTITGAQAAAADCAFAIIGRERTIDLECENADDRRRWTDALSTAVEWRKRIKKRNSSTAASASASALSR